MPPVVETKSGSRKSKGRGENSKRVASYREQTQNHDGTNPFRNYLPNAISAQCASPQVPVTGWKSWGQQPALSRFVSGGQNQSNYEQIFSTHPNAVVNRNYPPLPKHHRQHQHIVTSPNGRPNDDDLENSARWIDSQKTSCKFRDSGQKTSSRKEGAGENDESGAISSKEKCIIERVRCSVLKAQAFAKKMVKELQELQKCTRNTQKLLGLVSEVGDIESNAKDEAKYCKFDLQKVVQAVTSDEKEQKSPALEQSKSRLKQMLHSTEQVKKDLTKPQLVLKQQINDETDSSGGTEMNTSSADLGKKGVHTAESLIKNNTMASDLAVKNHARAANPDKSGSINLHNKSQQESNPLSSEAKQIENSDTKSAAADEPCEEWQDLQEPEESWLTTGTMAASEPSPQCSSPIFTPRTSSPEHLESNGKVQLHLAKKSVARPKEVSVVLKLNRIRFDELEAIVPDSFWQPNISFDEKEYENLKKRYLMPRERINEELPSGIRLRKSVKPAFIDLPNDDIPILKRTIEKIKCNKVLTPKQRDKEIFVLLSNLRDWEMNPNTPRLWLNDKFSSRCDDILEVVGKVDHREIASIDLSRDNNHVNLCSNPCKENVTGVKLEESDGLYSGFIRNSGLEDSISDHSSPDPEELVGNDDHSCSQNVANNGGKRRAMKNIEISNSNNGSNKTPVELGKGPSASTMDHTPLDFDGISENEKYCSVLSGESGTSIAEDKIDSKTKNKVVHRLDGLDQDKLCCVEKIVLNRTCESSRERCTGRSSSQSKLHEKKLAEHQQNSMTSDAADKALTKSDHSLKRKIDCKTSSPTCSNHSKHFSDGNCLEYRSQSVSKTNVVPANLIRKNDSLIWVETFSYAHPAYEMMDPDNVSGNGDDVWVEWALNGTRELVSEHLISRVLPARKRQKPSYYS